MEGFIPKQQKQMFNSPLHFVYLNLKNSDKFTIKLRIKDIKLHLQNKFLCD